MAKEYRVWSKTVDGVIVFGEWTAKTIEVTLAWVQLSRSSEFIIDSGYEERTAG